MSTTKNVGTVAVMFAIAGMMMMMMMMTAPSVGVTLTASGSSAAPATNAQDSTDGPTQPPPECEARLVEEIGNLKERLAKAQRELSSLAAGAQRDAKMEEIDALNEAIAQKEDELAQCRASTSRPQPANQEVQTNRNTPVKITLQIQNDNRNTGVRILSPPSNGQFEALGNGSLVGMTCCQKPQSLTYIPNPGFNGTDSFTFRAATHQGGGEYTLSDPATITIKVVSPAGQQGGPGNTQPGGPAPPPEPQTQAGPTGPTNTTTTTTTTKKCDPVEGQSYHFDIRRNMCVPDNMSEDQLVKDPRFGPVPEDRLFLTPQQEPAPSTGEPAGATTEPIPDPECQNETVNTFFNTTTGQCQPPPSAAAAAGPAAGPGEGEAVIEPGTTAPPNATTGGEALATDALTQALARPPAPLPVTEAACKLENHIWLPDVEGGICVPGCAPYQQDDQGRCPARPQLPTNKADCEKLVGAAWDHQLNVCISSCFADTQDPQGNCPEGTPKPLVTPEPCPNPNHLRDPKTNECKPLPIRLADPVLNPIDDDDGGRALAIMFGCDWPREIYVVQIHACMDKPGPPVKLQPWEADCWKRGQVYDVNTDKCIAPPPPVAGPTLVDSRTDPTLPQCGRAQLFNLQTGECQNICPQGQMPNPRFGPDNPEERKCIPTGVPPSGPRQPLTPAPADPTNPRAPPGGGPGVPSTPQPEPPQGPAGGETPAPAGGAGAEEPPKCPEGRVPFYVKPLAKWECVEPGNKTAAECENQGMMLDEVVKICVPCAEPNTFFNATSRQCEESDLGVSVGPGLCITGTTWSKAETNCVKPITCPDGEKPDPNDPGRKCIPVGEPQQPKQTEPTDRPAGPPNATTAGTPPPKPTEQEPKVGANITTTRPGTSRQCPAGERLNEVDMCVPICKPGEERLALDQCVPIKSPEPIRPPPVPDQLEEPPAEELEQSRVPQQPIEPTEPPGPTEAECTAQNLVLNEDGDECVEPDCGDDQMFNPLTGVCDPLTDPDEVDCSRFPEHEDCTAGGDTGDDDEDGGDGDDE